MKKFFVPQEWGDKVNTLAFQPIRNMASGLWQSAANSISSTLNADGTQSSTSKTATTLPPVQISQGSQTSRSCLTAKNSRASNASKQNQRGRRRESQRAMTLNGDGDGSGDVVLPSSSKEKNEDDATPASKNRVRSGRVEKRPAKRTLHKTSMAMAAADWKEQNSDTTLAATASAVKSDKPPSKSLKERLKEKLLGGRFRYINQQLYENDSHTAEQIFKNDPEAFYAYHEGYRYQVERWPLNPLNRIINIIRAQPKTLLVADFGCGDGKLAKCVQQKVYSIDLVSTRPDILECNMACTPLKMHSIDIAVYCLSLMGTNLKDYMLEANRILRMGGMVYIAEVMSRFEDERSFKRGIESCGFKVMRKDSSKRLFYFFQLKKVRDVPKIAMVEPFTLKPCLYRRR